MDQTRRNLLATMAGSVALAGCLDGGSNSGGDSSGGSYGGGDSGSGGGGGGGDAEAQILETHPAARSLDSQPREGPPPGEAVGTIVAFEDKRNPARSMVQLDERILEHIESEGWATPKTLARERGFPQSEGRITDRRKRLHYCGFLDPHHGEMYDITVEGRLYLSGDLDARHQPTPKASAVFERWSFPADWTPGPVRFRS